MEDPNIIFYIFGLMLAAAIPFLVFIAMMIREKHRDAGFHMARAQRKTAKDAPFFGENIEGDVL